jgi:hypothetical protein
MQRCRNCNKAGQNQMEFSVCLSHRETLVWWTYLNAFEERNPFHTKLEWVQSSL